MKSIALIISYFGKIPRFYNVWKVTDLYNRAIDFYIFTDDKSIKSEENIYVEYLTWSDMKKKIQSLFEFKVALDYTYKLCDIKPTYGEVFKEYLKTYDFWGYCDIDLLFGDIREFFTEEILENYDRCFYNAHISIYRNCDSMNNLYKFIEEGEYPVLNYKECYSLAESYYFDEHRGMYTKCLLSRIKVFDEIDIRRDSLEGERKFFWKVKSLDNQYIIFSKKVIFMR